ncbi:MAG: signal recognition particle-docking protein FtsY [Nitrospirota bacterium]
MGIINVLKKGLAKTKGGFVKKVEDLILGKKEIDKETLERLEEIMIGADIGVKATDNLIKRIEEKVQRKELSDISGLTGYLKDEIRAILKSPQSSNNPPAPPSTKGEIEGSRPYVIVVIGVNGVGKTTTIGKLAHRYKGEGKDVLLCAGDTFRAAAIEQLQVWGSRAGVDVIGQKAGADPSAVVFDACTAAKQRGVDMLIIDTAGRLHTKVNLMEELKKVKRVIGKVLPDAPHETLLILDATTGQNAISQMRLFNEGIGVTGLIITKLDGTAKGGIVIGIVDEFKRPIKMVGVGEDVSDLIDFNADDFVDSLFA